MIQRMKGTEDILPLSVDRWQYVEDLARDFFDQYLYREIRTPLFESYDLYARSVGDSTDIVSKEMYDFMDKGDRHNALRPEGTAGVVRAYVENKLFGPEYPQPLKVYYMGPMFRYERPQAGRQRQFNQLGVEIFGSDNPATDVEAICLAWDFFKELGLTNLSLQINSLGKPADRQAYREALIAYLEPHLSELSEDSQRRLHENPLRVLDSKDPRDHAFLPQAPSILDYLSSESQAHFDQVQALLKALDIPYQVNDRVVRGLDYYQDTIFEIMINDETIGSQATICGGGRYDGLVQSLGGPDKSGFGFGIGMERLLILLEAQGIDLPSYDPVDVYVMNLSPETNGLALEVVTAARRAGLIAERDYLNRSMKSQFKTSDKLGSQVIVTLGEEELASGQIPLKNTKTQKQEKVALDDLIKDFYGIYRRLTVDTSVIDQYFKGE